MRASSAPASVPPPETGDDASRTDHGDEPLLTHDGSSGFAEAPPMRDYACTPHGLAESVRDFFFSVFSVYTPRFTGFMTINYFLVKGFTFQAMTYVMLPYFKALGVSGSDYQKYYNIVMMSFGAKPLIGVISDSFPIGGYNKRYYCAGFSIVCAVSLACVNTLPQDKHSAPFACLLFFTSTIAVAALDLLAEGKYAEIMAADRTGRGPSVVSYIWMWYMIGMLIGAALEGTLAEAQGPAAVIWILSPWSLLLFLPSLWGWVPEAKITRGTLSSEGTRDFMTGAAAQHKGTIALGIASSAVALTLAVLSLLASNWVVLGALVGMSSVMLGASFAVLPRPIANANLFMYLRELFYLQINGPLDYYYTAKPSCIADAPHFSYSYYQSLANTVGSVAGLGGTVLFQRFLITGTFRAVFVLTTFLKIGASMFDLVIVERWNERIGLSDKATYMFGDAVVFQATQMLEFMPTAVLMSRMCPKGMEATIYALMAGISNLGQASSRTIGYMIADWLAIRTTAPCDFTNLGPLIVIAHTLLPLMILPLNVLLVPPGVMTSTVAHVDEDRPPTPPSEKDDMMAPETYGAPTASRAASDAAQFTVFKSGSRASES